MTFVKVIIELFLLCIVLYGEGQVLTPEILREQHDLGYGARTHYDVSLGRRTDMFNRINPDYLLRGFFPFWSIVLICFALIFLLLTIVAFIGYTLGCRRPTLEELYANEFEHLTPDDEFLLGAEGISTMNDTKISIQTPANDLLNNSQRDFRYESLIPTNRAKVGQSHEHMV